MNLSPDRLGSVIQPMLSQVNIGTGLDCNIMELAVVLKEGVGFAGRLEFDTSKPDGTPRKLLDVSRMNDLGWRAKVDLRGGLEQTYRWFLAHEASLRR